MCETRANISVSICTVSGQHMWALYRDEYPGAGAVLKPGTRWRPAVVEQASGMWPKRR